MEPKGLLKNYTQINFKLSVLNEIHFNKDEECSFLRQSIDKVQYSENN